MLRRLAMVITAICIVACFLSAIAPLLFYMLAPIRYVHRNSDGSNIGYYVDSYGRVEVRPRGFGPDLDRDSRFDPTKFLPLAAIPPTIWYFVNLRTRPQTRFRRWLKTASGVCALFFAVIIDIQNIAFPFITLATAALLAIAQPSKPRLSRAEKRRLSGKCPTCGYDLRATPDPTGPRLEHCPECGTPAPRKTMPLASYP
jgi:hypothetical protein